MEYGLELWDTLWEAGQPHGLVAAGYRAIDSLRLEKGYRYWSADITPDDTPYEAGLGFAVKLGKGDFIGRDALVRQRAEGVRRKLACLTLVRSGLGRAGRRAGRAWRAAWWGASRAAGSAMPSGFSIAYAYLPAELASPGTPVDDRVLRGVGSEGWSPRSPSGILAATGFEVDRVRSAAAGGGGRPLSRVRAPSRGGSGPLERDPGRLGADALRRRPGGARRRAAVCRPDHAIAVAPRDRRQRGGRGAPPPGRALGRVHRSARPHAAPGRFSAARSPGARSSSAARGSRRSSAACWTGPPRQGRST